MINTNMKNITLTIIFAVMLTGCGLLPNRFDNVEFGYLSELRAVSTLEENCNQDHIDKMKFLSSVLLVYSKNTLNENTANIYKKINNLAVELSERENPSDVYCRLKRENIAVASDNALEIFGKRIK
jgi:hypothetical protein